MHLFKSKPWGKIPRIANIFYSLNSRKSETSENIISKSLFQVLRCASGGEGPFFFSHKKKGIKNHNAL